MATIHVKKKHNLDKKHIRQEVEKLADKLSDELSAEYKWENDRLVFERTGANGFIQIGNGEVEISINLNLLLRPLKGTIEKTVNSYLDEHLT